MQFSRSKRRRGRMRRNLKIISDRSPLHPTLVQKIHQARHLAPPLRANRAQVAALGCHARKAGAASQQAAIWVFTGTILVNALRRRDLLELVVDASAWTSLASPSRKKIPPRSGKWCGSLTYTGSCYSTPTRSGGTARPARRGTGSSCRSRRIGRDRTAQRRN